MILGRVPIFFVFVFLIVEAVHREKIRKMLCQDREGEKIVISILND